MPTHLSLKAILVMVLIVLVALAVGGRYNHVDCDKIPAASNLCPGR